MKKYLALWMALLLTMTMLTGCGGSSFDSVNGMAEMGIAEPEAPAADNAIVSDSASISTSSGEILSEQKLIRQVRIEAETEDLETLLSALSEQVGSLGGYIEEQEVYNGSRYASYRYRSASLVVRIPAENLNSFVGEVRGLSNVVTFNESTDDVTLNYVATESRVAALQAEESRLLELMEKAETMSDLLEIEKRLTEVRSDLESTTSQLRVLANKVSYATVYLDLQQVEVYTEVEEPTVWERITGGFSENLKDIGEDLVDFMVWAITYSPQLIFWALIITLAVTMFRRRVKTRRERRNPPKPDNEEKK